MYIRIEKTCILQIYYISIYKIFKTKYKINDTMYVKIYYKICYIK
ncbi:hypothetical protein HMPREF7545_1453 [Selenomonas noxia ATCC 43541]|nr:hypothetical protein HMPREF7545_1453 [Selenomonas noxia ATCC 43541]